MHHALFLLTATAAAAPDGLFAGSHRPGAHRGDAHRRGPFRAHR